MPSKVQLFKFRYISLIQICINYEKLIVFNVWKQSAALVAVANIYESLDENSIRKMVLPKLKIVYEKNQNDLKIIVNVLQCIERILDKLDKSQVCLFWSYTVY